MLTPEQIERNLYWAERFEEEALALEKGPNDPIKPALVKAMIDSSRSMANDLRAEIRKSALEELAAYDQELDI